MIEFMNGAMELLFAEIGVDVFSPGVHHLRYRDAVRCNNRKSMLEALPVDDDETGDLIKHHLGCATCWSGNNR